MAAKKSKPKPDSRMRPATEDMIGFGPPSPELLKALGEYPKAKKPRK